MIGMKVCKLHMCTSTYAYNYTRSSSSYWCCVFIILNWNLLCSVVYLKMYYSIAIIWIFIHVKKYIKITTCSIS